jgi:hypothetical protein
LGGFFRGLVFECNGCFFYGDFRESNLYNWSVRRGWRVDFMLTLRLSSCLLFACGGMYLDFLLVFSVFVKFKVLCEFSNVCNIWVSESMPCTPRPGQSCSFCVWDR